MVWVVQSSCCCWGCAPNLQWFKKRGRVEWDRYWHGPLALLRLKLEAVPAEVPRSAFRVLGKHDVMSNWEFPLAGGLRRHLSSVPAEVPRQLVSTVATDFGEVVQSCSLYG